jgi:tight adherence protein C
MNEMILLAVVFAAVVLAVLGVGALMRDPSAARRLAAGAAAPSAPSGASLRFREDKGVLSRLAAASGKSAAAADTQTAGQIRRQLIQAGFVHPNAVAIYFGSRTLLAAALPLVVLLLGPLLFPATSSTNLILMTVAAAMLGYIGPGFALGRIISTRQRLVREGFPDALDMLVVCVEAGLGLDAAIARVGDEIAKSHPLLSEQIQMVGRELRAGKSREDALRNLAGRIGIEEVSSLVSLLIQTDKLGTSMSQALKAYSEDMRAKRMLRAEEKANSLGVKMSFPLILFILPALFIAIMSPAAIKVMEALLPVLEDIGKRQ